MATGGAPTATRQRDVFPLPHFSNHLGPSQTRQLSRTTARRQARKARDIDWTNEAISALNELAGRGLRLPDSVVPSSTGVKLAQSIRDSCFALGAPPSDLPSPQGALSELLAASGVYSGERADIGTFSMDKVSWPEVGASPTPLLGALPSSDSEWFRTWDSHMLRDPQQAEARQSELGLKRVHKDPDLFRTPGTYFRFLHHLEQSGMLRWERAKGRKGALCIFNQKEGFPAPNHFRHSDPEHLLYRPAENRSSFGGCDGFDRSAGGVAVLLGFGRPLERLLLYGRAHEPF